MRLAIGLILTLSVVSPTSNQALEISRLEGMLMAPCCYTQTIRDHMSDVAAQMRQEVTALVLDGQTEQAILRHYKAIYGEAILAVPDGLDGQIAFGVPLAVFLVSGALLGFILVKFHRPAAQTSMVSRATLPSTEWQAIQARIRAELGD